MEVSSGGQPVEQEGLIAGMDSRKSSVEDAVLAPLTRNASTIKAVDEESIKEAWAMQYERETFYDFCILTPENDTTLQEPLKSINHLLLRRGFTVGTCNYQHGVDIISKYCLLVLPSLAGLTSIEEDADLRPYDEEGKESDGEEDNDEPQGKAKTLFIALQLLHAMEQDAIVVFVRSPDDDSAEDGKDVILNRLAHTGAAEYVAYVRDKMVGALGLSASMTYGEHFHIADRILKLFKVELPKEPSALAEFATLKFVEFAQGTRQWVFSEVAKWSEDPASKLFMVLAGRGAGKTVLASEMCRRSAVGRSGSPKVAASFFFGYDLDPTRVTVRDCIYSVHEQLRSKFQQEFKTVRVVGDPDVAQLFESLVAAPTRLLQPQEKQIIIVDGIDSIEENEKKGFFNIIRNYCLQQDALPSWLNLLVTSQEATLGFLRNNKPFVHFIDIEDGSSQNQLDIARYLQMNVALAKFSAGKESPVDYEASLAQSILSSSSGNFLYSRAMALVSPTAFGLRQIDIMDTCFTCAREILGEELYHGLFELLCVAREPLPMPTIQAILKVEENTLFQKLQQLDVEFFRFGDGRIVLSHALYREWLVRDSVKSTEAENQVKQEVGHKKLGAWCLVHANERYAQRHALVHLARSTAFLEQATEMFLELNYLLTRTELFSVDDIVADGEILLSELHTSDRPIEQIEAVRLLVNALRLSKKAVQRDYRELPSQLLGRILDSSHPTYKQAKMHAPLQPWLQPLRQSLTFANEALINCTYYGNDALRSVQLDAAGRLAVTSHFNSSQVRVWNVTHGLLTETVHFDAAVVACRVLADGSAVLVALENGHIVLTDLKTKTTVFNRQAHESMIRALDVTSGGGAAVSCCNNGSIKLWDVKEGRIVGSRPPSVQGWTISCVLMEKSEPVDGIYAGRIVVGYEENTCVIYDGTLQKTLGTLEGHKSKITALAADPNLIASASFDTTCKLWNLKTAKCIHTCEGHEASVTAVAFISEGTELLSASLDKSIRLWSTLSGEMVRIVFEHYYDILHFDVSQHFLAREGFVTLMSGTKDGYLQNWEIPELIGEAKSGTSIGGKSKISHVSMSSLTSFRGLQKGIKGIKHIKSGLLKLMTRKYRDASENVPEPSLEQHKQIITCYAFSTDGRVVTGSRDAAICVWEVESGQLLDSYCIHAGIINSVAFCPTLNRIVSSSDDGTVKVYDLDKVNVQYIFEMPGPYAIDARYSPSGRKIVAQDHRKELVIWDLQTLQRIPWDPYKKYKVYKPKLKAKPANFDEGTIGFTPDSNVILTNQFIRDVEVCVIIERENVHFLKVIPVNV